MVNQVVLIGRITRDIEIKATTTRREVCNFSIAVNRNFKNASGEYEADFINCVAFGQTAKFMSQYLDKGRLISVVGRMQTRNYENNMGQRVYITEVIAESVNGLDSRRDTQTTNNYQSNNSPQDFMNNNVNNNVNNIPEYNVHDVSNSIDDSELPF